MTEKKAVLLFDGECGFCRFWVLRWSARIGTAVDFRPGQEAREAFPDITPERLAAAVVFIDEEGLSCDGAEAVFRVLARRPGSGGWGLRFYSASLFFRRLSEGLYSFVAARRPFFSLLTRLSYGASPEPSTYQVSRWLYVRALAACYLIAFASLWAQLDGLVGSQGIVPAAEFLKGVSAMLPGAERFWQVPTLLWLSPSDAAMVALSAAGVLFSLVLAAGFGQIPTLIILWAAYLSLVSACGIFLGFQWDNLLLEAGLLAVFLAPWSLKSALPAKEEKASSFGVFLTQFLLFKLMFSSGVVKLLSGDAAWWNLTALAHHFETQCLPTWPAWYFHQLPSWALRALTGGMFVIELVLPFFYFAPRRPRMLAGAATILFMSAIALTGNYTFFNLLTAAMALLLFDDAFWKCVMPKKMGGWIFSEPPTAGSAENKFRLRMRWSLGGILFALSLIHQLVTLGWRPPRFLGFALEAISSFRSVNGYGLFAVMTTERNEIVLEGTMDGREWKEYEFKYKPGAVSLRPGFVAPHQPRLDWQMWFAVLAPYDSPRNRWFYAFAGRILEGSKPARTLLKTDPFPDVPPRALRATVYRYRFTQSGPDWWTREPRGLFCPYLSLKPTG